jgi:hypothetical protein
MKVKKFFFILILVSIFIIKHNIYKFINFQNIQQKKFLLHIKIKNIFLCKKIINKIILN